MVCPRCGKPRRPIDRYCVACGLRLDPAALPSQVGGEGVDDGRAAVQVVAPAIPVQKAPEAIQVREPTQDPLACPSCGRVDLVCKVSAIVSGETTYGNFSGTSFGLGGIIGGDGGTIVSSTRTNLSGMSQTHLSSRLAPPPQPYALSPWGGCSRVIAVVLLAVAGLFFLMLNAGDNSGYSASSLESWRNIALGAAGLFVLLYFAKSQQGDQRQKAAAAAQPAWQAAMARWNRQYYCGRCDRVFEPENV